MKSEIFALPVIKWLRGEPELQQEGQRLNCRKLYCKTVASRDACQDNRLPKAQIYRNAIVWERGHWMAKIRKNIDGKSVYIN